MWRALMFVAALMLPIAARAVDVPGTITVLEGDALIYRGAGRLAAAEGVRLATGDIIETGTSAFMQVEAPDRSVIQLGPATRAMLGTGAGTGRQKSSRWLFVMNGWCKIAGPKSAADTATGLDIRTRWFDIPSNTGVEVMQSSPVEVTVFAERGDIHLDERQAAGNPIGVSLKTDDFYHRTWPERGAVNAGSTSTFVAAMPRSFRDSLPLRIDKFKDQDVRPKDAADFTYADVEPWLKGETWLRRPLVQRWRGKAKDPAFRAALIANLPAHPEWDPILFPEKYIKRDAAAAAARRQQTYPATQTAAPAHLPASSGSAQ